jgi:hypothetical protein
MSVGAVRATTPASPAWPSQTAQQPGAIAFEDLLAAVDGEATSDADPTGIDIETVATHALGIADEEDEKKKREKRRKDAADGPGSSSAAPSAQEAFEMAQKWLMQNYQVSERVLNSLQAAGADVTESAAPDAAAVGGVVPATAETGGAETAIAVKPAHSVAFI